MKNIFEIALEVAINNPEWSIDQIEAAIPKEVDFYGESVSFDAASMAWHEVHHDKDAALHLQQLMQTIDPNADYSDAQ